VKKIIISAILFMLSQGIFAQAKSSKYALPYFSFTRYSNTFQKDFAVTGGLYGYYGYGLKHSFESDLSYTAIHFDNLSQMINGQHFNSPAFTINQADITFIYTNYQLTNLNWRAGAHAIFTDDALTNNGFIIFSGLKRYRSNYYSAAVDVYGSFYNAYSPNLNVLQVDGTFGFYFGNYFTTGSFFAETKGSYIELSDDIGFGKTQFPSVKQSLFYYRKNFTLEAFLWTGFRVFAVTNSGFVVFNLAEKHLGALGGSLKYALNNKASLKLKITHGRFKELGLDDISKSFTIALLGGYSL